MEQEESNNILLKKLISFCKKNKIAVIGCSTKGDCFSICSSEYEKLLLLDVAKNKILENEKIREYTLEAEIREKLYTNTDIPYEKKMPSYAN